MEMVKRELQEKKFRMSNCHSGYGWWHRVKEQPVVHIKNAFKPAPVDFEYQADREYKY